MNKCKNCGSPTLNKSFCSVDCYKKYKFQKCKRKKRSKLEKYLSSRLKNDFPQLNIEENNRTVLQLLELDIYLPQINIAIEINGKMHYQFVKYFHKTYQNFKKQQIRDRQKKIRCQELGIELIEIPNLNNFNIKNAEQIYNWLIGLLKNLVQQDKMEELFS